MTSGLEPATFRLGAYYLDQLGYRVPQEYEYINTNHYAFIQVVGPEGRNPVVGWRCNIEMDLTDCRLDPRGW
jgi:hypothetical protein